MTPAPPQLEAWDQSVRSFLDSLEEMRALVLDRSSRCWPRCRRDKGRLSLREILLLADHNAYHLGQLVQVRKALKAWPKAAG